MKLINAGLAYLIFLALGSFGLWSYFVFKQYDIASFQVFWQNLLHTFEVVELRDWALKSLMLGAGLAGVATYIWMKAPPIRRKSKGHVRGSELFTTRKLSRLTQSSKQTLSSLAEVPIPIALEPRHFLIGGSTGAGKSVAIAEMLRKIIPRGDRVIMTDPNGEFLSRFYCNGDVILNPFDQRGTGWSMYNEIRGTYDYERFSKSVIPPASNSQDAEWHSYAQLLFSETAKLLLDDKGDEMKTLADWLTRKPADELGKLLKGTAASGLFTSGAEKALASTRFIISRYLAPHQYLKPGNFSIRKWLEEEKETNLFITWREDMADALRPLISTWMDIVSTSVLSLPPNSKRRIWLIIDELASLERLNSFESALTKGRKHGLRIVVGLQSTAQLDKIYGREQAVVLRSCFRNLLILSGSASDPETAEVFSRGLGERDVERKQKSTTRNRKGLNRTETLQRIKERIVLPSEIMNLKDLHGYLSLAGDYPIAKVKLTPPQLQERVSSFIEGEAGA